MAEKDGIKTGFIAAAVIGTVLVLAALVFGVQQMFDYRLEAEISHKVLEHESSQLRLLRAEEDSKLNQYQWVDRAHGVVRIPVERAVELTLRDAEQARAQPPKIELAGGVVGGTH